MGCNSTWKHLIIEDTYNYYGSDLDGDGKTVGMKFAGFFDTNTIGSRPNTLNPNQWKESMLTPGTNGPVSYNPIDWDLIYSSGGMVGDEIPQTTSTPLANGDIWSLPDGMFEKALEFSSPFIDVWADNLSKKWDTKVDDEDKLPAPRDSADSVKFVKGGGIGGFGNMTVNFKWFIGIAIATVALVMVTRR